MKILYFGTVCELNNYNELLKNCRSKPSVSTIVFENALLDGFSKNGIDMEIHSFPMVPVFPHLKKIFFGRKKEKLPCGYEAVWLRTINIPVLKQISRSLDARRILRSWGRENTGRGIVFTYSIPPFLVKTIIRYSRKYSLKTVAIIPDLLRDMYINEKPDSPVTKLKNKYIEPAMKMQGEYDGYIYLTEAMRKIVAPDKPYIVMEGIASSTEFKKVPSCEKSVPRAIMYAGMLHRKYGIINLLDAFDGLAEKDTELWLFGDGSAVPEIKARAEKNKRIRYFGMLDHDKIIEYERKSTLIVNPRDPDDEFTAYSFPSKTIEYMLSGTPLLTTKLKGIPDEYFNYVFSVEDNSCESLLTAIEKVLSRSPDELKAVAESAAEFIAENKNSRTQAAKIKLFLEEVQLDVKN